MWWSINVLHCFQFIRSVECKGHSSPVCAVDTIYTEDSKILVASSASDSTVRLWLCSDNREGEGSKYVLIKLPMAFLKMFLAVIMLEMLQIEKDFNLW